MASVLGSGPVSDSALCTAQYPRSSNKDSGLDTCLSGEGVVALFYRLRARCITSTNAVIARDGFSGDEKPGEQSWGRNDS